MSKILAISWQEQATCQWDDDDDGWLVFDQHPKFDFYSRWLKQQFAGRNVAPLRHIILITSQPIFALTTKIKLDTTLCDKVCQWLAAGQWFSLYNIMW